MCISYDSDLYVGDEWQVAGGHGGRATPEGRIPHPDRKRPVHPVSASCTHQT